MYLSFMRKAGLLILCGLAAAGCEQLGIETPAQMAAAKEAEGRAIGSACRHSGRALEDCYTLNTKAIKSAIFTGWRDMDAYMRENNLEIVPAVVPRPDPSDKKKKAKPAEEAATEKDAGKLEETPAKAVEAPTKKEGAAQSAVPLPPGRGKIA